MENTLNTCWSQSTKLREILDTPNHFPKPPQPIIQVAIFGADIA